MYNETKSKKKSWKIVSYFRELSVVVIGVAITFFANNLITEFKEKNDLNQQLKAIYMELADNMEKIDDLLVHYEKVNRLKAALLEFVENPQQQNRDSVNKYAYILGKVEAFSYKKGAYEMFLNSGAMKLLVNRKHLLDITESYNMLEILKEEHDRYTNLQTKQIEKLYDLDTKQIMGNLDITEPQFHSIRNFFISVSKDYYPEETKKQIEKVLLNN
ncbi:MAG: hypothetical protein LBM67_07420 [Lentimicrobiaceae bacterium]|jgi:hypothetical protein|nr:hypothetical protein [Lentimicrobiaceae bacterium]